MPNNYDVIFFSSPRSVKYFFSDNEINSSFKIACIGEGTAASIKAINLTPDFIGINSGIPEEIAQQFKAWLGDRIVLFPLAKDSKETIYKHVSDKQKKMVRCYETVLTNAVVSEHEYYVFTSPSNVQSFMTNNTVITNSHIIAWGRSTAQQLEEKGLTPIAVLEESSEEALVKVLIKLM